MAKQNDAAAHRKSEGAGANKWRPGGQLAMEKLDSGIFEQPHTHVAGGDDSS